MDWISEKAGTNTPPKNPPLQPSRGNKIIREGYVKKGGVNQMSKTPRPKPPIGQEITNKVKEDELKSWHLKIRDMSKPDLVSLVESMKVKLKITDYEMNELVINLKDWLDT